MARLINKLQRDNNTVEYIYNVYGNDNKGDVIESIYNQLAKSYKAVDVRYNFSFGGRYIATCKI